MLASTTLRNLKLPEVHLPQRANSLTAHLERSLAEAQLGEFHDYIEHGAAFLHRQEVLSAHRRTVQDFFGKFEESFNRWRALLSAFGVVPNVPGKLLDMLHLGMWDTSYANDPQGRLTPFGPPLAPLGELMGGAPIGIFHALVQQLAHPQRENLRKAQALAVEMYAHFLAFAQTNTIQNLKMDKDHPPLLQLHAGGGVTWFSGLPVPTMIATNQAKAQTFGGFSAVPHEFGHDLSGTFNEGALAASIQQRVRSLAIPHTAFWEMWVEEAFADVIGTAILGAGEIFSLANLFSGSFTNIIFTDESGQGPDEHPNRHLRVLLTIEVGRRLGLDNTLLDRAQERWMAFGETINTAIPSDFIFDQFHQQLLPMNEFLAGIDPVAEALVDTVYEELAGKKVRDIFAGFSSSLADELRDSIDGSLLT